MVITTAGRPKASAITVSAGVLRTTQRASPTATIEITPRTADPARVSSRNG